MRNGRFSRPALSAGELDGVWDRGTAAGGHLLPRFACYPLECRQRPVNPFERLVDTQNEDGTDERR